MGINFFLNHTLTMYHKSNILMELNCLFSERKIKQLMKYHAIVNRMSYQRQYHEMLDIGSLFLESISVGVSDFYFQNMFCLHWKKEI